MNYLQSTIDYVLNAENWTGAMGLGALMTQHVGYSLLGVGVSALIGVPLDGGSVTPARGEVWP